MKKLLLLVLLSSPLLGAPPPRDWMRAFEDESPTAVLLVHYRGDAEGGSKDLDFAFEGICTGILSVTVTEHLEQDAQKVGADRGKQIPLGTLPLRGKDPARFSKLLDYYKKLGSPPGMGANVEHVVFQKVDRGKTTVLAEVDDSTGGLKGRSDVLTFDEILSRIRQAESDRPTPKDPMPVAHPG